MADRIQGLDFRFEPADSPLSLIHIIFGDLKTLQRPKSTRRVGSPGFNDVSSECQKIFVGTDGLIDDPADLRGNWL